MNLPFNSIISREITHPYNFFNFPFIRCLIIKRVKLSNMYMNIYICMHINKISMTCNSICTIPILAYS